MLRRLLSGILARNRGPGGTRSRVGDAAQLISRAQACQVAGELQQAEALYRAALEAEPRSARSRQALGVLCARAGRLDEARAHLENAVALDPTGAAALSDLGQVCRLAGAHDDAEQFFRRALTIDASFLPARLGLAQLMAQRGEHDAAIGLMQECLQPPVPAQVVLTLVDLLDGLRRHEQAKAACENVIAREPAHAQAHASLGFLLVKRLFEPAAGLDHLNTAIEHMPGDAALHITRAVALRDLARIDESIDACDRALALDEGNPMARFHRAIALLYKHDFQRAWADYEARLETNEAGPRRVFPYVLWNGEDLEGRTILVHAEQGIGDEIMFASCMRDLAARARHVTLECSPKLVPLFARSFPGVSVCCVGEFASARSGAPDYVTPSGSLPLRFRRDRQAFGDGNAYLRAEQGLIEEYRRRVAALGSGIAIGISWRGGTTKSRRALRSLDPHQLVAGLDAPGVHWVSLQYDASAAEVDDLSRACGQPVHHWQEAIDDYDRTAALMSGLDLVISVCTAVVHLGGALGCPVWVAAHRIPEWRYGIEGEAMPWYGSVRIFRQEVAGDWRPVIARMAACLRAAKHEPRALRHALA